MQKLVLWIAEIRSSCVSSSPIACAMSVISPFSGHLSQIAVAGIILTDLAIFRRFLAIVLPYFLPESSLSVKIMTSLSFNPSLYSGIHCVNPAPFGNVVETVSQFVRVSASFSPSTI